MFELSLRSLEEDFPNYDTKEKIKNCYLDIVTLAEFILREDDPTLKEPIRNRCFFEIIKWIEYYDIDPLYDPNEEVLLFHSRRKRWTFSFMWNSSRGYYFCSR